MLAKIQQFITKLSVAEEDDSHSIEVSAAVLLFEVMKADGLIAEQEKEQLTQVLLREFSLTATEVNEVIDQASYLSEHAHDFYQFTSTVNQHFSAEQRIQMVKCLWQLAYADGSLSSIEEHVIRKIADLLHLRQSEFIQAKLNSQT